MSSGITSDILQWFRLGIHTGMPSIITQGIPSVIFLLIPTGNGSEIQQEILQGFPGIQNIVKQARRRFFHGIHSWVLVGNSSGIYTGTSSQISLGILSGIPPGFCSEVHLQFFLRIPPGIPTRIFSRNSQKVWRFIIIIISSVLNYFLQDSISNSSENYGNLFRESQRNPSDSSGKIFKDFSTNSGTSSRITSRNSEEQFLFRLIQCILHYYYL